MENFLAEGVVLKQGILPQSNNGALAGERFSMNDSARVAIVISMGDSTAAAVDVNIQQHDAASAGTSKDLTISTDYFHKAGAATSFTRVEGSESSPVADFDLASIFAADEGIAVFEVLASNLDVNNGFNHISVDLGAAGEAKIVSVVYHGHQPFKKSAHEVDA